MLSYDQYQLEVITSWKSLISWYSETTKTGEQWIFRGLREAHWGFASSLERAYNGFGLDPKKFPIANVENGLVRRFIRQSHRYLDYLPDEENTLEWLSIMQHYGAPTRLLDWTHSLFIALFFAVEQASGKCAVWALKHEWATEQSKSLLCEDTRQVFEYDRNIRKKATFDSIFSSHPPIALALPVKPYRLNERLIIQQGTFLCPGDISRPFDENLSALFLKPDSQSNLIKIVIEDDSELRQDILKNLNRMNLNAATLYPGLAGFAQSLRTIMIQPEILIT